MMKDVECPTFEFPACPVPKTIMNQVGSVTQEKIDEMDINAWKKNYELVKSLSNYFGPVLTFAEIPVGRSQIF